MVYTTNYVPNPSFQQGLTGYTAVGDAVINLDTTMILYGPASLLVSCPGTEPLEGVSTAGATIPFNVTGSASVFLQGTGNVTVSAVTQPDGTVLSSTPVVLSEQWTRVVIINLALLAGQTVNLVIETTSAAQAQFRVSGVQIEDTSPAHPYCDGDQIGCIWVSGPYGGISEQLYMNPVAAVSAVRTGSNLVNILSLSASVFAVPIISKFHIYDPVVIAGSAGPAGAVTDFSVALLTDPDPAQTYVSWNNAGIASAPTGSYVRSWGVFIPPKDYIVSGGQVLYNRAAYAAAGWLYSAVPNGDTISLTKVQAEVLPLTTGYTAPSPSAFDTPRAVHSILVADRINFVTNPSFEISTANWTALGTATLAQDNTVNVGQIAVYDDTILTAGTHSCNVTVHANSDGAQINITNLIPGYNYIASAYVQAGQGLANILMSIGNGATSVQAAGGTGYNSGAYNIGPYGGFNPTVDLSTGTWWRLWCIFTANADSEILEVTSSTAADVVYPTHMWVDAVLVEQGEVLAGYFDGSAGRNYTWDSQSGSPGLARSYFYDQMAVKEQAVLNTLSKHTPLGISYAAPLYSVPPIQ